MKTLELHYPMIQFLINLNKPQRWRGDGRDGDVDWLKELRHRSCFLKKIAKLFKIVISNPFQSSPSSAILVPFGFRINPLVFFFLSKPLFLGSPTL